MYRLILIVAIFTLSTQLFGKNIWNLRTPDNSELTFVNIYEILEDSKGDLWIASPPNIFQIKNGEFDNSEDWIIHNRKIVESEIGAVRDMIEDSKGNIITRNLLAITLFDGFEWRIIQEHKNGNFQYNNGIFADAYYLYVSGYPLGVHRFDYNDWTIFPLDEGMSFGKTLVVNDNYYMTNSTGLLSYDGEKWSYQESYGDINFSKRYRSSFVDNNSNIWVILKKALVKIDLETGIWTEYNCEISPFEGTTFNNAAVLDDNSFLLSYDQHLVHFSEELGFREIPDPAFPPNGFWTPRTVYVDSKNRVWVGTFQDGLIWADLSDVLESIPPTSARRMPRVFIYDIVPNPATNSARVRFYSNDRNPENISVSIYDLLGNEFKNFTFELDMTSPYSYLTLNTGQLNSGSYFVHIKNETDAKVQLFIKK